MSSTVIEKLLSPVSAAEPVGTDLSSKAQYIELERLAQGTPAKEVGSAIIPAVPPDWNAVRDRCAEMLLQTKDLRLALHLVVALLQTEGLPGFRDGLRVLKGLLEQYWDLLYPRLDPQDGNDPTERINILQVMTLRPAATGNPSLVKMVRATRLTSSRQLGGFGLRDIEVASANGSPKQGDGAAADGTKVDLALIEASAKDTDRTFLTAAATAATESAVLVRQIEAIVDEKVGVGNGVDLKDLARALDAAAGQLHKFLGGAPQSSGEATSGGQVGAPVGQAPVSGEIRSPEDVKRLIDRICEFYARTEPSSPVPIVLRRAQRLVGKNFWEILTDLSPGSLDSVKAISGTDGPEGATSS